MDTQEAVRFINNDLTLKPGWTIRAQAGWRPGMVELEVRFAAQDSNYPPDYKVPLPDVPLHRSIFVQPYMEKAHVSALILQLCLETEAHEWQELLRYRDDSGRWVAPFHPHRRDGQRNWLTGAAAPRLEASLAA